MGGGEEVKISISSNKVKKVPKNVIKLKYYYQTLSMLAVG